MLAIALFVISVLRALAEVAGMFLLAQGFLFVVSGKRRDDNAIYQLFSIITRPVVAATRMLLPKAIINKHIPFVTFFLLFWSWILLAYLRQVLCQANRLACV